MSSKTRAQTVFVGEVEAASKEMIQTSELDHAFAETDAVCQEYDDTEDSKTN